MRFLHETAFVFSYQRAQSLSRARPGDIGRFKAEISNAVGTSRSSEHTYKSDIVVVRLVIDREAGNRVAQSLKGRVERFDGGGSIELAAGTDGFRERDITILDLGRVLDLTEVVDQHVGMPIDDETAGVAPEFDMSLVEEAVVSVQTSIVGDDGQRTGPGNLDRLLEGYGAITVECQTAGAYPIQRHVDVDVLRGCSAHNLRIAGGEHIGEIGAVEHGLLGSGRAHPRRATHVPGR